MASDMKERSNTRFLSLETWAQRRYPDKPPSIYTLRPWVKDCKIVPVPRKHGRRYRVDENAVYQEYS